MPMDDYKTEHGGALIHRHVREKNPYDPPELDRERWEKIRVALLAGKADAVTDYEFRKFLEIATYPVYRPEKF